MRMRSQSAAAIVAALLVCAAAATAGAGRIRTSSQQIRHTWPEWTVNVAGVRVTCPITLEGSVHSSTIAKTARLLVGYIDRAANGTCATGSMTLLTAGLPWHIRYDAFTGTLPNIAGLSFQLVGLAFLTTILGVSCLYLTTATSPGRWIDNLAIGGGVTSVRWREAERVPSTTAGCPEATFSGSGSLTQSGTATPISITLI